MKFFAYFQFRATCGVSENGIETAGKYREVSLLLPDLEMTDKILCQVVVLELSIETYLRYVWILEYYNLIY